jgi:membrane peptidoglycan carboxypeptidase
MIGRAGDRTTLAAVAGTLLLAGLILDLKNSWFESLVFGALDRKITYHLDQGPSNAIAYPNAGPYDWTLGYARMPVLLERLSASGYSVEAQARDSQLYSLLTHTSLYPVYRQKNQAGLIIADRDGSPLYSFHRPERVYQNFSDIPPVVTQSLLFIENRHMLEPEHPYRNPAVEWDRLSKAMLDYGLHAVNRHRRIEGGSTLATQLEKLRHSPGGRTHSASEKLRQMASATLAAYENGRSTLDTQRQIVRDYVNSIPLAAAPRYGDVEGLADGLWVWYGTDASKITPLLAAPEHSLSRRQLQAKARAYREVLSLLLALRAPHVYLVEDPNSLRVQTDRYLRALCDQRIISTRLRDLALREYTAPLRQPPPQGKQNFIENKAPNSIRMSLMPLLGMSTTYDLDRLDLTVGTTIDQRAQQGITQFLETIASRKQAAAAGLQQYRLLEQSDPRRVLYSVTLYECAPGANLLRVQTDNLDQPLNINQDTRLELGSTAKLRTLINYLEIVEELHKQYSGRSTAELQKVKILPDDHLTEWAVKYLAATKDRSLNAMLQAALQRKYSGGNGESFFTGGGVHHFENFESWENGANMTVSDAFQNSVNLVFIRLMRDVVNYYRYRVPGSSPAVLENADDPARRVYLSRFADEEGRLFLGRFYKKYAGQTPDQALNTALKGITVTPVRAAVIFRSVRPEAGLDEFKAYLKAHLPKGATMKNSPEELYAKYGQDRFDLSDRGYLARVNPLELWLLNYREQHPGASLKEIWGHSAAERQEVYWWLFKTEHKTAQDNRIRTLLEQDAFKEIYRAWKRQGYPFDSLVSSYATTIGVSGDTPAALAELMGILLHNGERYPNSKIQQLHFGPGTPTETIVSRKLPNGQRVIAPEIAALVRKELVGVVENGTGRRAHGGIVLSDGKAVPVGGKTGTGDNRLESFSARGSVIGSKVTSRTATFVFTIGDRFYGTILAFVPGSQAASYRFTSALAVQIFKDITPQLKPLIERAEQQPSSRLLASNQPSAPQ